MRALILSGKQAFDNGLGVSFEVFFFFFFFCGGLLGKQTPAPKLT